MLKVLLTIGFVQVLTMLVMLVRTKSLAVLLGPEAYGVMSVVDRLVAVFYQTAAMSLPFAAIRFLPAAWSRGREAYASLLRTMAALLLALTVAASLLGLGLALVRPSALGAALLPYRPILMAAFLTLPVLAFVGLLQNSIAGRLEHNRAMLFALVHAVVFAAASIAGVAAGGLVLYYVFYAVGGAVLVLVVLRRLGGLTGPKAPLPPAMLRFSLALLVLTFASPYAALYVGYAVLHRFGSEAAGYMQAAVGVALAVRGVLGSAHPVFLTPQVNREAGDAERMRWTNEFQKTLLFLVGVTVPPLLLVPDLAVRLLYSVEFVPGARVVALFVLVEVLTFLAGTYGALVIAYDHMAWHVGQNLVAQAVQIGAAWVLLPRLGIAGAAVAGLLSQVVLYAAIRFLLRWKHGLTTPLRTKGLLVYVLSALALAGWLGVTAGGLTWSTAAARAAVYALLVAGLALFLTRDDRANLRRIVTSARQISA